MLVEVAFVGKAKDGPRMDGTFFAVFTVRNNLVLGMHEHTTRAEALMAADQLRR